MIIKDFTEPELDVFRENVISVSWSLLYLNSVQKVEHFKKLQTPIQFP